MCSIFLHPPSLPSPPLSLHLSRSLLYRGLDLSPLPFPPLPSPLPIRPSLFLSPHLVLPSLLPPSSPHDLVKGRYSAFILFLSLPYFILFLFPRITSSLLRPSKRANHSCLHFLFTQHDPSTQHLLYNLVIDELV